MYKIWLISVVLLLFFFISGCENKFHLENSDKFDLSTKEWRQRYCEKELIDKYGNDYDVEWDSDGEYVWWFIIGWLLYMWSNYYDLECQWNENTVNLQLNPIEKLEYESVYE
jgi:hypothetical protein